MIRLAAVPISLSPTFCCWVLNQERKLVVFKHRVRQVAVAEDGLVDVTFGEGRFIETYHGKISNRIVFSYGYQLF